MALRDILALFEIKIEGAELLGAVNAKLDDAAQNAARVDGALGGVATGSQGASRGLNQAAVSADRMSTQAGGLHQILGGMNPVLLKIGAAFAAAFSIRALVDATRETLTLANEIKLLSNQTGLTTEAVQVYQEYLKRAGVQGDGLVDVTGNLAERLGDAVNGSKEAAATFKALNVATTDTNGQMRDLDLVLPEVLESLADLRTPTERMAWASKIWGDTSAVLTSNLGENSEALREQLAMLKRTAVVFSDDFVNSAKDTSDEISLMSRQLQGVKASLLAELLPALRWVVDKFTQFGLTVRNLLKETSFLRNAFGFLVGGGLIKGVSMLLTKFGGVKGILSKLRPLLGILARFALKFLLPFFLLDDIITFLEGGDSMLGRWLDKLGPGTADVVRAFFGTIWGAIKATVASVVALFKAIFTGSDEAWAHFLSASQPIVEFIDNIGKWFADLWAVLKADIAAWLSSVWGSFSEWLWSLGNSFGDWAEGLMDTFAAYVHVLTSRFATAWDMIKESFFGVWNSITSAVSGFFEGIGGRIAKVAGMLGINIGGEEESASPPGTPPPPPPPAAGQLPAGTQQSAESAGRMSNAFSLEDHRSLQIQVHTSDPQGVASAVSRTVNSALNADRNAVSNALVRD